jgi:hypothetical protein
MSHTVFDFPMPFYNTVPKSLKKGDLPGKAASKNLGLQCTFLSQHTMPLKFPSWSSLGRQKQKQAILSLQAPLEKGQETQTTLPPAPLMPDYPTRRVPAT